MRSTSLMHYFTLFAFAYFLQKEIISAQEPYIANQPSDVIAIAGNDVLLQCSIENLPLGSLVQWTKGSFGLGYDRVLSGFPRYSITGDESIGEYNLLIKNSTIEDEDEYECQVTSYGIRTNQVTLTVQAIPNEPWVAGVRNHIKNVRENAENQITCHAINGKPTPSVIWYRDQTQIKRNVSYAIEGNGNELQNTSATLTLWPSNSEDGVKYTCSLSMDVIKEGNKIRVIKNNTLTIRVQKPPRAIVILEPSSSIVKGTRLSALCDSVTSDPPVTQYMWYLNGKEMDGKTNSRVYFNDVTENMNGYRIGCQAFNSIGKSPISSMNINVLYPPVLVTGPKERTVDVGGDASFGCEWEGNPVPEITWTSNDKVVGKGNILYLNNVQQSDAGEVKCIARSEHIGRNVAKTRLVVNGPPVVVNGGLIKASIGDEVKVVQCRILSTPGIATVTWKWVKNQRLFFASGNQYLGPDGNIVKNKQGVIKYKSYFVSGEPIAQMFIYNIDIDDMTIYNCSLANDYGVVDYGSEIIENVQKFDLMIVIYVIAGVVAIVSIMLICLCIKCCKGRNKKKEKLPRDHMGELSSINPPTASQSLIHHSKNDPDSDNQSTQPSSSVTPDELMLLMRPYRSPVPNDDGYYTEAEAHSHLPRGTSSLSASSGNNSLLKEQISPLLTQVDCRTVTPSYIVNNKHFNMPQPASCMLQKPTLHQNRHYLPSCRLPSPRTTADSDASSALSAQTTNSSHSPYRRTNVYSSPPQHYSHEHLRQLSSPIVCGSDMEIPQELIAAVNHDGEEYPARMATNV